MIIRITLVIFFIVFILRSSILSMAIPLLLIVFLKSYSQCFNHFLLFDFISLFIVYITLWVFLLRVIRFSGGESFHYVIYLIMVLLILRFLSSSFLVFYISFEMVFVFIFLFLLG